MYNSLLKIYHSDRSIGRSNYEKTYKSRYNSAICLNFYIHKDKAFFIETNELKKRIKEIYEMDKNIKPDINYLPSASKECFIKICLINEVVSSNEIEGIDITQRKIHHLFNELEKSENKKLEGLVSGYKKLMDTITIEKAEDIRKLYDNLLHEEIMNENSENRLDGELFRKYGVDVMSSSGTAKVVHRGVNSENKIIETMNKAINILKNEEIDILYRISIFHYLFGYIHPFYDGNGRTSRFISSYLLSKCLEPLIGYRISYVIQKNKTKYEQAFRTCNNSLNKGDLTPFVDMFIEVIYTSMKCLEDAFSDGKSKLKNYLLAFKKLELEISNEKVRTLYNYLLQVTLFTDYGFSIENLMVLTKSDKNSVVERLKVLRNCGILIEKKIGNEKFFTLDLEVVDKIILDNEQVD